MATNIDPWHFPRTELAERYLGLLTGGLANALVMFGRPRTGKTEFLLHDLAPAAERVQRIVVYVNFWASPLAPATVLTRALERALKGGPLATRLAEAAKRVTPRLKLSGGAGGLEGEAALELGNVGAGSVRNFV